MKAAGFVPPDDFYPVPERVREIAQLPLEIPLDLPGAVASIRKVGLFRSEVVEDAIVALTTGHLLLTGPPGTGKTFLAHLLADAFAMRLTESTANPEWSVYDMIGSQTIVLGGHVEPRHGVVTRSILDFANQQVKHQTEGEGERGVWLLIDELNRAEVDRAFGPLFTALSVSRGSFPLDYIAGHPELTIPEGFRIIAAVNDYDSRFVNGMSGALRRRFARVVVLPPANESVGGETLSSAEEFTLSLTKSAELLAGKFPDADVTPAVSFVQRQEELWRRVFGGIRSFGGAGGIPIGTAQVIDCFVYTGSLVLLLGDEAGPMPAQVVDRAIAARVISGLESDATRLRADGFLPAFKDAFPEMTRTISRLERFLGGLD